MSVDQDGLFEETGSPATTGIRVRRFARLYSDGSLNVSTEGESFERAKQLLSGSTDDDDTQLVQVDVRIVRSFGQPKLRLVTGKDLIRETLERAMDCILGETPEDCTREEAAEDTIEKIKCALRELEGAG